MQESDQIISGSPENLELVKLNFRAELKLDREEFSFLVAKTLPEAFLVLRRSVAFTSISCLLSRFLYALDMLGKQCGGQECVERATQLLGKAHCIEPSACLSRESQFHQCLIQICANLPPAVLARLKAYFIDTVYGKNNFFSLAYIFTILLNDGIIDQCDQRALIRALLITQANDYIKHIIDYREANGLPLLVVDEKNLTTHGKTYTLAKCHVDLSGTDFWSHAYIMKALSLTLGTISYLLAMKH